MSIDLTLTNLNFVFFYKFCDLLHNFHSFLEISSCQDHSFMIMLH